MNRDFSQGWQKPKQDQESWLSVIAGGVVFVGIAAGIIIIAALMGGK